MKATTLNVDSWHYQLALKFGYDAGYENNDICSYTRRVALGLFVIPFLFFLATMVTAAASYLLVHMVLGPYFWLAYGIELDGGIVVAWLFAGIIALYVISRKLYQKFRELPRKEKEPGFLKLAYLSYKDKYCVKLQFVDKDGQPYETWRQREQRENREAWEASEAQENEDTPEELETTVTKDEPPTTTGSAP